MGIKTIGTAPSIPDIGTVGSPERTFGQDVETFMAALDSYLDSTRASLDEMYADSLQTQAVNVVYNSDFQKLGGHVRLSTKNVTQFLNGTILNDVHPAGWQFYFKDYEDTENTKGTVTFTAGSPGVVNLTAHGLTLGTPVYFTNLTGVFPSNIYENFYYYVIPNGANTFWLAASQTDAYAYTATNDTRLAISGSPTLNKTCFLRPDISSLCAIQSDGFNITFPAGMGEIEVYQSINDGLLNSEWFDSKTWTVDVELTTTHPATYVQLGAQLYTYASPNMPSSFTTLVTEIGQRTRVTVTGTFASLSDFEITRKVVYAGVRVDNTSGVQGEITIHSVKAYQSDIPIDVKVNINNAEVGEVAQSAFASVPSATYSSTGMADGYMFSSQYDYRYFQRLLSAIGSDKPHVGLSYTESIPGMTLGTIGYIRNRTSSGRGFHGDYLAFQMQAHKHADSGHTHRYTTSTAIMGATSGGAFTASTTTATSPGYVVLGVPTAVPAGQTVNYATTLNADRLTLAIKVRV